MKPALLLFAPFLLMAQFGQNPPVPYPPGHFPGGNDPHNTPQGGNPRGGQNPHTDSRRPPEQPSTTYHGVVRKVEGPQLELELEDTRFLIIDFSIATSKPADLRVGDGAAIAATEDKDGRFHAETIQFDRDIAKVINENDQIAIETEGRTAPPPTILVRPNSSGDDDDAAPPKLKHGKPPEHHSDPIPEESSTERGASATKGASATRRDSLGPHMALVEKARDVAATFLENLPNYIVQESATRYASETRTPSWNVVDLVTAEVVFDDHHETYRNVQINGKATKKAPEESGAWSTGEFGTVLGSIFSSYSDAEFKFAQDDTIAHRPASVFDFKVQRLRSNWRIWTPGQYILPAYRGSFWIDKETGEVLRIEQQAREIPEKFPEVSIETAVDYESIRLGTAEKFLLPVHAEVLSCWRGSNDCERNVIEFRNYHKFTGESTIEFK